VLGNRVRHRVGVEPVNEIATVTTPKLERLAVAAVGCLANLI
jgi:hypothetical protein